MTADQAAGPIDGSGTSRARCVLAPNPGMMTLDGTNTWLVAEPGSAAVLVIDPGPDEEPHLRRICQVAAERGQRVVSIVLTHRHLDHSAGAPRLSELTGAPVLAVDPDHRLGSEGLSPGDVLDASGCELRVIKTPGHTADSVSLRLLADETGLQALLPGHGPLLADPAAVLDFYLTHRAERLDEVRSALAAGDRAPAEIVPRVYAAVDRALWPFAESSVRAQLRYLGEQGELPPGVTY